MTVAKRESGESEAVETEEAVGGVPVRGARARRWCFRCLLVVGSLGLALGLCEAVLWVVAPVPYHEWLIWEAEGHIRARPMPNQVIHTAAGDPIRLNEHGFRGPDYTFDKPPGTLRIVVFGGSAAFCYHAAGREKSWPGALELKLGQRLEMPVEVINLGLPGFDAFNSKINYLCFGRAFNPDAIIVYHTWNDMKRFRGLATRPYRPRAWVPDKPLWQRIARATQLGRRGREFYWKVAKVRLENIYSADEQTGALHDRPVAGQALEWERQNFVDLANLALSDGVLPVLVTQASLLARQTIEDPQVRLATAPGYPTTGMTMPLIVDTLLTVSSIIKEVAQEKGAIFVDGYQAVPHDLEHMRDAVHLHDAGSEALAEEIARVLTNDHRFRDLVDRVRSTPAGDPAETAGR